jgi:hypothetical protein
MEQLSDPSLIIMKQVASNKSSLFMKTELQNTQALQLYQNGNYLQSN